MIDRRKDDEFGEDRRDRAQINPNAAPLATPLDEDNSDLGREFDPEKLSPDSSKATEKKNETG